MSTNVAMTVLLSVVCGGAALFGAGKTWAEERAKQHSPDHYSLGRVDDAKELVLGPVAMALVWAFVAFLALVATSAMVVGIAALVGA